MTEYMNEEHMIAILETACREAGSQRAWAEANGLSPAFVNDVLQGKRGVTGRIAEVLGYTKFSGFYKQQAKGSGDA
jgi:hypothetical protein